MRSRLAERVVSGEVYLSNNEEVYKVAFAAPLTMADLPFDYALLVGAIYEEMDKAVRHRDGVPVFLSCRFLHVSDVVLMWEEIDRLERAAA